MQEVKRMDLVNELESVRKGLSGKEILEQSTSFIFQNGKVLAYNDEIFAIAKTSLDIEGAVEADALLKLLNKVSDEYINVEINENEELIIKGKRFSTGIKLDSEIRIPIDDLNLENISSFQNLPENFSQLAKLACLTAAKSLHMPLLTCVHLDGDTIESCDNDRITTCKMDTDTGYDVLIPAKNLLEIVKEKIVATYLDESWIHFKTDENVILSSRVFNEEYVDLANHIPGEKGHNIKFPKEIEEIISRADIFSKDTVTSEKIAHIKIKNKKLEISAQNESGWFKERAKVNTDTDFTFSINTDFLKDVIKMSNEISILDDILMFEDTHAKHLIKLETEGD